MPQIDDLKSEIAVLVKKGYTIAGYLNQYSEKDNHELFLSEYEPWYTKSLVLIDQFLPQRKEDFMRLYTDNNRKELNIHTYSISDALNGITISRGWEEIYNPQTAVRLLFRQVQILKTCLEIFDSRVFEMKSILQRELFDSDLRAAKHLLNNGYIRASGAIAGVVFEKYLATQCLKYNLDVPKPGLSNYNNTLKKAKIINQIEWRENEVLIDIRNKCDHLNEPTTEETTKLIDMTEKMLNTTK
ncbi:MAG: hypothetical protein KBS54_00775 [Synergistaceae bacterium]|nr:hypothetical protein [Candidatus Equadaptatus faecalis]